MAAGTSSFDLTRWGTVPTGWSRNIAALCLMLMARLWTAVHKSSSSIGTVAITNGSSSSRLVTALSASSHGTAVKCSNVSGALGADGAPIIQWDWNGGDNQRWVLIAPIVAQHSGQVLDVKGVSTDSGATIQQWPYHGFGNQLFRIEPVTDEFVRFVAIHSGKVLDVYGASTASGAQLIQWDWNGGDNQLFRLEPLGDGNVRIVAKHSGKVLDVSGASGDNGALVIQWDWNGGANQRWLVPQW